MSFESKPIILASKSIKFVSQSVLISENILRK